MHMWMSRYDAYVDASVDEQVQCIVWMSRYDAYVDAYVDEQT